jgi:hypothetical protein
MDFVKHFSGITDYRDQSKISHLLTDIVGLCLLGTIADCDSYQDIEDFGKHNELWLRNYLQLPNGIPSHDTMEICIKANIHKPCRDYQSTFCPLSQKIKKPSLNR